jgi:hypothetical protein
MSKNWEFFIIIIIIRTYLIITLKENEKINLK